MLFPIAPWGPYGTDMPWAPWFAWFSVDGHGCAGLNADCGQMVLPRLTLRYGAHGMADRGRLWLCRKKRHLVTLKNEQARYCPQCARNARRRVIKVRLASIETKAK